MHIVDRYRVVLLTVVLAFFGSYCAFTATAAPYNDSFESYGSGTSVDGNNGWLAVSTVVATNAQANTNVIALGTNSCYIPAGEVATNDTSVADTTVWVDFYAQVQLMGVGAADPTPADGVVAQFFFNSSGYPVVLNGTTTNWVALTTDMAGGSVIPVTNDVWARVSVFMNYTNEIWSLFVDDSLIKDDISFHTSASEFDKIVIENETYLDDLWVNTNRPDGSLPSAPALTSDTDGDGMGDAFELDYWGDAAALGSDDEDDDGRSNAQEFSASPQSNPLVPDSTSRSLPFRDAFESSVIGVKSNGWHGMTNSGTIEVVSGGIEGSKALSLSNGLMNVTLDSNDGTNVWVQIYTKPVIAQNDSEPAMSTNDVACFYVASGGVLRAWSEGDYTNLMTGIPSDTWLAFAVHLDYNVSQWNLYVSTNGVFGDNMVRANATEMLFNTNASSATSLTNIIIELAAETNMLIDVLAASYGNTNLVSTHTNLLAYDRLVGTWSEAAAPPYNYWTNNSLTNTLASWLGEHLMWGMEIDDELQVYSTNAWDVYTLSDTPPPRYWKNDGSGLLGSEMVVDKGTAMKMKKATGSDQVVFYPYGELVTVTPDIVVAGTDNPAVYGWNYLTSPFSEIRTFNHVSLGICFTNVATAGDRIYLRNEEYIFNGSGWMDGRNAASVQLAPGEAFWYFNKDTADFNWSVTGL